MSKELPVDVFHFIQDEELRGKILQSIAFVFFVREELSRRQYPDFYREEMCRVVVLYIVSVIEAVLLSVQRAHSADPLMTRYTFVAPLPREYFHRGTPKGTVVIAVQQQVAKHESEISFRELVVACRKKGVLSSVVEKRLIQVGAWRNTLHLGKKRDGSMEYSHVNAATALLKDVLSSVARFAKRS